MYFLKKQRKTPRDIIILHLSKISWWYDLKFLKYSVTESVIMGQFFPFHSPHWKPKKSEFWKNEKNEKNKKKKKKKNNTQLLKIFYKCVTKPQSYEVRFISNHLKYQVRQTEFADILGQFSDWKVKFNISKMLQCSDILLYNFPPKQT